MSSRLFQTMREEHGLAYSIHSGLNFYDDVGALVISAGLDPEHLAKALKIITRELQRCVSQLPRTSEIRQARDYLIGQLDLSLETTDNQMTWLGEHLLAYRRIIPPHEVKQRLKEINPSDVKRVARQFLRPDHAHLAIVSPRRRTENLLGLLRF
jgi:predicted Zn-dependent peptidase